MVEDHQELVLLYSLHCHVEVFAHQNDMQGYDDRLIAERGHFDFLRTHFKYPIRRIQIK